MKKNNLLSLLTIVMAGMLTFSCGTNNDQKDPSTGDVPQEEIPDHSFTVENLICFKGFKESSPVVKFNNEKYATDNITYTIDLAKGVHAKFNKDSKTFSYLNDGVTVVKAATENYETTFKVVSSIHEFNDGITNALLNIDMNKSTAEGGTIFFGDSFFDTRWFWTDFYKSYKDQNINTVGISSTTIEDWVQESTNSKTGRLFERVVLPYKPSQVICHLGSNDIYDDRKNPEGVLERVKALISDITEALPETKIFYLGTEVRVDVKTGFAANEATVNATNNLIEGYLKDIKNVTFVETKSLYTKADGSIDASFFKDGIHPTLEKYKVYNEKLIASGAVLPKF